MSNQLSSWTGQLPTDVLLDSGVLYINGAIFSAQDGGLKYEPGKTTRQVAFDGQRSPIAGLDRTVEFKPTISGVVMEVPNTAMATLEPGATAATVSGGPSLATQIQPKAAGILYASGDYIVNARAVWERGDGTYFQVRFPKAVVMKWSLAGKDKEEGKFDISIEARLDMSVSGQLVSNPPVVYEYFTVSP